jgi:serine/threonine protein kinase
MNPTPDQLTSADDPRLLRAVQEYLAELEAGRHPDRRAFAARFPDLSEKMAPYLDALDAVHAAAPPRPQLPVERPAPAAGESYTTEPLGDFRILREIGRGGMGVVYEAVQLSLGRQVALKVLPFAAALDARQLQRFKNEAQAAAQLHHTNIVPVYYVGCERGVHFYAMQLIEGQNLEALLNDLRRCEVSGELSGSRLRRGVEPTGPWVSPAPPAGNPASGELPEPLFSSPPPTGAPAAKTRPVLGAQLSTQRTEQSADFFCTIARLIAQAAEALDYAHGLGIIHRDIKPANLLLDARGNIWVTDFGLAQFHANVGLTQTGALVGTLRYMSPEQAGGQRVLLDHRTDVYSLGATLYELLTLRPIFDGANRQALLQQILHEDPRPPRSIDRSIPTELETIVLKAVAKAPAERYATAREFADDLHRFLRYEPILARPVTLLQRGRKWLRRHPSVPVAAIVMLVLLAAGSLFSAWLIRGAYERERQRASEAEARFELARQAADEMIEMAEEELSDHPFQEGLRKRLLEAALAYYQQFINLRQEDPDAQADLARTRDRVEGILANLAELQANRQIVLLRVPAVLEDLRVSSEQRASVAELVKRLEDQGGSPFREFAPSGAGQRRSRPFDFARTNEAGITTILSRNQLDRLRQIALQCQGPMAFREPEVARELKLTVKQKEQIHAEASAIFSRGSRRGGPPAASDEQKLKTGMERIQAVVLTQEQAKRWKELTGAPYTGPKPVPGRGGPSGPPP